MPGTRLLPPDVQPVCLMPHMWVDPDGIGPDEYQPQPSRASMTATTMIVTVADAAVRIVPLSAWMLRMPGPDNPKPSRSTNRFYHCVTMVPTPLDPVNDSLGPASGFPGSYNSTPPGRRAG